MSTLLDRWTLGRLLAGWHVNGELQALSERFGPIGRRLSNLPEDARAPAWEAYLDGQEDRDELVLAIANTDISGPAPVPESVAEDEADGWGPIRIGSLPPAEPFPLELLPGPMARLVTQGAAAIGCQPDFIAVPALVVAGGAIGRSVSLRMKAGYFAFPGIYAACVGPPSDGKSPALDQAASAIRRIDEALEDEHAQAMTCWEESNLPAGPKEKQPKPGPRPRPRRIDVDDITMEALVSVLADNPRGLVQINDEVTSLFMGMNQYKAGGKGNDKPMLLKVWSGKPIKKDRAGREGNIPDRCPHPCFSIVGGLPPDMLGSMVGAGGRADGFLDRWLFAYPEQLPVPGWSTRGLPDEVADEWADLVARLWARAMASKDGREIPHVIGFSAEGEAAWIGHYDAHSAEMNSPDFPPPLRGAWGKLREYAGRLALILACVHQAADPIYEPEALPRVGPEVVDQAWRLVAYFKAHDRRVHAAIRGKGENGNGDVHALLGWIGRNDRTRFSIRDIERGLSRFDEEQAALVDALSWMAARNIIRPIPRSNVGRPGRTGSPRYDVNPAFWKSPRFRQYRQIAAPPPNNVGNVGFAAEEEAER